MSRKSRESSTSPAETVITETPRCKAIADQGIKTTGDIMRLESAMISDIISNRVDVKTANVVTAKCGNLLKAASLQHMWNVADGRLPNRAVALTE